MRTIPLSEAGITRDEWLERAAITKGPTGFDREDETTLGILQYCHDAADGTVYQINEDMSTTILTSQTTFADGTTALVDRTLAQYHSAGQTNFSYWRRGVLVEEPGIKTVEVEDGGGYYIYEEDGELHPVTNAHDAFVSDVLTAYAAYNETTGQPMALADERHGIIMDGRTHESMHYNTKIGFSWTGAGLDVEGLVDNGTTFTKITGGHAEDEDILHTLAEATIAPFLYRDGASGEWAISAATDNKLGLFVDDTLVWNENTSGDAWQLTKFTADSDYVIMSIWATNNAFVPFVKIVGQANLATRAIARDRLDSYITGLKLNGLPTQEMMPIAAMILHRRTTGQIEKGADEEIWIDYRAGFPAARF